MIKKFLKWFKDWNGFLTKKDGYLSKPELHAFGIGSSYFLLGYMLPTPLGELTILSFLFFLRIALKKSVEPGNLHGHMADVIHEYAYTMAGSAVTVVFMEKFTSYTLTSVEWSSVVAQLLIGG